MFCCALSYTNSEESFLIKEASVVGLCRGSIQSGVILVQTVLTNTFGPGLCCPLESTHSHTF